MRTDPERLRDITEAIELVRAHSVANRDEYERDEVKRWFFLKQIEIVGEASWKLSARLKECHPEIPWKRIAGMRHILVHDYWSVDWDLLWQILEEEIEPLRLQVQKILHDFNED